MVPLYFLLSSSWAQKNNCQIVLHGFFLTFFPGSIEIASSGIFGPDLSPKDSREVEKFCAFCVAVYKTFLTYKQYACEVTVTCQPFLATVYFRLLSPAMLPELTI